jgi:hypothetical protein
MLRSALFMTDRILQASPPTTRCGETIAYDPSCPDDLRVRSGPSLQQQPGNIHQNADRRDVPHERTSQRQVRQIQDCVDDATPKVEVGSPRGEPAVRARHSDDENCSGEEWKGLKIVSKCSFGPSGNAGERRNAVFP